MLFHTTEFLFIFLPIVLMLYYVCGMLYWKIAFAWLSAASLFFYGWWDFTYVYLICSSIVFNYAGARLIFNTSKKSARNKKWLLLILVTINILGLIYFKYLMLFASTTNSIFHIEWDVGQIVLPIGISFYTFTQIAYLVDVYHGKEAERSFISYSLFVLYFPHLVAGPILHHAEMMPQFNDPASLRLNFFNIARGFTLLGIGLFKKVVLADTCAPIAKRIFDEDLQNLSCLDAWSGALAYTLQIYYDFSGYSDMAVGLSLLFNINLPINFFSPYQSRNIIDFWRRWHITLSRFLRDYLYIPLGGNRRGSTRKIVNLFITMALGGLWHGANWTFLVWGVLHGVYLGINHAWRGLMQPYKALTTNPLYSTAAWTLTLVCVMVAWVFFRADSLEVAWQVLLAMIGLGSSSRFSVDDFPVKQVAGLMALLALAMFAPSSNLLMRYFYGGSVKEAPSLPQWLAWKPNFAYGVLLGVLFFVTAVVGLTNHDSLEFLYFQF